MLRIRRFLGLSLFLILTAVLSGCDGGSSGQTHAQGGFTLGESVLGEVVLGAAAIGNTTLEGSDPVDNDQQSSRSPSGATSQ